MNVEHFRAFLWLRWRLRINQLKRGGVANAIILVLLAMAVVCGAIALFITFFLLGLFLFHQVPPVVLLFVWDGLVVAFLFSWLIGLVAELQRSESLSLSKFMHLPVSLSGAFVINYLASLLSVTLVLFLPAMVALSLALIIVDGPLLLLLVPLLASFIFAVTALTYQFQGWLAALMSNPRRRRTVIVLLTASLILLGQIPNLVNLMQPWKEIEKNNPWTRDKAAREELNQSFQRGEINVEERERRSQELNAKFEADKEKTEADTWEKVVATGRFYNLVVPLGWLPLGALTLKEGNVLPALLGTLAFALVGSASLWRAYGTTLRLYSGQFTSGAKRPAAPKPKEKSGKPATHLLEKNLPWVSEQATAVALGGLQSLLRAPETKMMLVTPVILVIVFGGIFLAQQIQLPEPVRPLIAFGATSTILLTLIGLLGNQFGFDRGGFRVFVLSPAPRRDIVFGKNLAIAPLAFGLIAIAILAVQVLQPMRLDHFVAMAPQVLSMFLVLCFLANWMSIFAPMRIAPGSFKPSNPKMLPVLLQMIFVFLFPICLAPTLFPLGIEVGLEWLGWIDGVPLCLALSILECVAVVYLYRLAVTWQGSVLQARELKILDLVTTKTE
jgi:ABC-2 type transport system permease protein